MKLCSAITVAFCFTLIFKVSDDYLKKLETNRFGFKLLK